MYDWEEEEPFIQGSNIEQSYFWITTMTEKDWEESKTVVSVSGYKSDYHMYLEVIDLLIDDFEREEDYERCKILLDLKNYSIRYF